MCKNRICEDDRKYSVIASPLLRVYVAVKTEKRVKMGNYLCKSCRNKDDWWHRLMSDDFDELDLSLENDSKNQDEDLTVTALLHFMQIFCCLKSMEIGSIAAAVPSITTHENESNEEDDKNNVGSVKLGIWRTSKTHR